MLDNVGLRYPHRASGAKVPRTLRPLPLLRFAVSATGGAHLCSIQYYLRFWLSSCRTSLAVSALRIMRYCLKAFFFVFWFPIFAAFRNGQDRSLQNVLGRIANLQNIRRALRPQARFGGQPPRRNLADCTLYFATPLNPICRGRCLPSARRAACTAPCPLTTTHYPLSHDAHAATSPIVRVMCPSGAASATNNTPGRAVPAAMRSARACSTARLTLRRSSRAP